jgi:hypothetical protein
MPPSANLSSTVEMLAMEMLAEVFARGRELEDLWWNNPGLLRMRQVVQIKRAQIDFERFRESLALELTKLHTSLGEALATVIEAGEMTSNSTAGFSESLNPVTAR